MLLIYIEDERERKKETKTVVYCFYRKTGGKKGISRPFFPPKFNIFLCIRIGWILLLNFPVLLQKNRRRSFKSRDVM